jgi:hypothetical protein
MKLRYQAMAAALVAIRAGLCPHGALAAERSCPGISIEADAGVRDRWPDLVERIQSELSARANVDACARVGLRLESDAVITVSVTLPDGRAPRPPLQPQRRRRLPPRRPAQHSSLGRAARSVTSRQPPRQRARWVSSSRS